MYAKIYEHPLFPTSQNAQIPTPASKSLTITKNPPKNYPIAKLSRHKKITIWELAYSACFVYATEVEISQWLPEVHNEKNSCRDRWKIFARRYTIGKLNPCCFASTWVIYDAFIASRSDNSSCGTMQKQRAYLFCTSSLLFFLKNGSFQGKNEQFKAKKCQYLYGLMLACCCQYASTSCMSAPPSI